MQCIVHDLKALCFSRRVLFGWRPGKNSAIFFKRSSRDRADPKKCSNFFGTDCRRSGARTDYVYIGPMFLIEGEGSELDATVNNGTYDSTIVAIGLNKSRFRPETWHLPPA
jgi:hypothetical protein